MANTAKAIVWPPTAELKVVISASAWNTTMRRARLAAVSKEGKYGRSKIGDEQLGCLRIVAANGVIMMDSSVSKFAVRHTIVADGSDAAIVAAGVACVPVQDLQTVVGKLRANYAITIAYCPGVPDETTVSVDMRDKLPVGEVEIGVASPSGVVTVARCLAFSPTGFLDPVFVALSDLNVVFTGKASCMRRPYADISFSIDPDCPSEIFNKVAIFMDKYQVHFLGSDGRRCAMVRSKADKFETYNCIDDQLPLLIEIEYLTPVLSSLSDNDPLTLAVAKDCGHVYIISDKTTYRIAMVGEQARMNYPAIGKLLEMKVGATVLIDRKDLLLAATSLYAVCDNRGGYSFKNGELHLLAKSSMAIKAANAIVPCTWGSDVQLKRTDLIFNTGYLIEGLRRIGGEKVKLMFTPDERKVRIEGVQDSQLSYYIQVIQPPPPPAPSVMPLPTPLTESPACCPSDETTSGTSET